MITLAQSMVKSGKGPVVFLHKPGKYTIRALPPTETGFELQVSPEVHFLVDVDTLHPGDVINAPCFVRVVALEVAKTLSVSVEEVVN